MQIAHDVYCVRHENVDTEQTLKREQLKLQEWSENLATDLSLIETIYAKWYTQRRPNQISTIVNINLDNCIREWCRVQWSCDIPLAGLDPRPSAIIAKKEV